MKILSDTDSMCRHGICACLAGRDFACGEAIGSCVLVFQEIKSKYVWLNYRRELDKPCHDRVIEHEEFMCGIEVEHFCGKYHENKTAFHECIKAHGEELKKTYPELEKFDKFEEREAINVDMRSTCIALNARAKNVCTSASKRWLRRPRNVV